MSKSMAVAIVALFFSLTGWGVAAKVAFEPNPLAVDLRELCGDKSGGFRPSPSPFGGG